MKRLKSTNFEKVLLAKIIKDWICWEIAGYENSYLDEGDEFTYKGLTKEDFVEEIYLQVITDNENYLCSPIEDYAIEKKNIRFLGKKFLVNLIEELIEKDYKQNGRKFPNNYNGMKRIYKKEIL